MRNLDYKGSKEGQMMKNRLRTIQRVAAALDAEIQPTDNLPQWTLAKVATAQDRLTSAMQYLSSRIELQEQYGSVEAYKKMAQLPIVNNFLPVEYDIYQTETHYCLDRATEEKLQKQRKFTYLIGGPAVLYAGLKLKNPLAKLFVSALGVACTLTHYAQYQAVKNAPFR